MRGGRGGRGRLIAVVAVVLLVGVGGLLVARSRRDAGRSPAEAAEQRASCERLLTFSAYVGDPSLSPATPAAPVRPEAVTNVLTRMAGDLDALAASAPGAVRGDVRTLVGALRAQPGDPTAMRAPGYAQARQHLAAYLAAPRNGCQAGSESGSG